MVIRPGYRRVIVICLFTVFLLFLKCCFIRWSMSKKLFFVIVTVVCTACFSRGNYTVTGTVDSSYDGKTIYLESLGDTRERIIDSTVVADGKFEFRGRITGDSCCIIRLEYDEIAFVLEAADIQIGIGDEQCARTDKNAVLYEYFKQARCLGRQIFDSHTIVMNTKDAAVRQFRKDSLWTHWKTQWKELAGPIVSRNDNALGAFVCRDWISWMGVYQMAWISGEPFRPFEDFDTIYAMAGKRIRSFRFMERERRRVDVCRRTAEGMPFVDFPVGKEGADSGSVRLADYIGCGKYVLVDFWNSYSDTSYVADLRDIWKNNRGDRFEILGVVLRRSRSMALTAFEKLQRPWPQVFDDKNLTSESYGFGGGLRILFGPDGKIIARGIHRDSLKTRIAEILGE